jgi:hypothetical protein
MTRFKVDNIIVFLNYANRKRQQNCYVFSFIGIISCFSAKLQAVKTAVEERQPAGNNHLQYIQKIEKSHLCAL